jgi:hypothetical protein
MRTLMGITGRGATITFVVDEDVRTAPGGEQE